MKFTPKQLIREGIFHCKAGIQEVFPLLCPKREEEWIPGWECETLWSKSGYNEEGAIFRTLKPYGTELYWTTLQYDITRKMVDFLITAPRLYQFRFRIKIKAAGKDRLTIKFMQVFTPVSEEGTAFLKRYESEDFNERLKNLENFMNRHLEEKREKKR
jgi:hypothetical protein